MDEIDRVLGSESVIRPTAGFAVRVMAAVREEAAAPAPIAFPWRRFLPGALAGLAILVLATLATIAAAPGSVPGAEPAAVTPPIDARTLRDIGIVAGALLLPGIIALRALRARSVPGLRF